MIYEVQAPYENEQKHMDSIFIAGGISGCSDWQRELINILDNSPVELAALNPRRDYFDMKDPHAGKRQIAWEYKKLHEAHAICFWFTDETVQPITLFELGRWSISNKPLFVGCHPNYSRRLDVVEQLKLSNRFLTVRDNLQDLADDIICAFYKGKE